MLRPPPKTTLFPYTTLFRSSGLRRRRRAAAAVADLAEVARGRVVRHGHAPLQRDPRSEEHTSELQSRFDLVCRLLLEKKKRRSKMEPQSFQSGSALPGGGFA